MYSPTAAVTETTFVQRQFKQLTSDFKADLGMLIRDCITEKLFLPSNSISYMGTEISATYSIQDPNEIKEFKVQAQLYAKHVSMLTKFVEAHFFKKDKEGFMNRCNADGMLKSVQLFHTLTTDLQSVTRFAKKNVQYQPRLCILDRNGFDEIENLAKDASDLYEDFLSKSEARNLPVPGDLKIHPYQRRQRSTSPIQKSNNNNDARARGVESVMTNLSRSPPGNLQRQNNNNNTQSLHSYNNNSSVDLHMLPLSASPSSSFFSGHLPTDPSNNQQQSNAQQASPVRHSSPLRSRNVNNSERRTTMLTASGGNLTSNVGARMNDDDDALPTVSDLGDETLKKDPKNNNSNNQQEEVDGLNARDSIVGRTTITRELFHNNNQTPMNETVDNNFNNKNNNNTSMGHNNKSPQQEAGDTKNKNKSSSAKSMNEVSACLTPNKALASVNPNEDDESFRGPNGSQHANHPQLTPNHQHKNVLITDDKKKKSDELLKEAMSEKPIYRHYDDANDGDANEKKQKKDENEGKDDDENSNDKKDDTVENNNNDEDNAKASSAPKSNIPSKKSATSKPKTFLKRGNNNINANNKALGADNNSTTKKTEVDIRAEQESLFGVASPERVRVDREPRLFGRERAFREFGWDSVQNQRIFRGHHRDYNPARTGVISIVSPFRFLATFFFFGMCAFCRPEGGYSNLFGSMIALFAVYIIFLCLFFPHEAGFWINLKYLEQIVTGQRRKEHATGSNCVNRELAELYEVEQFWKYHESRELTKQTHRALIDNANRVERHLVANMPIKQTYPSNYPSLAQVRENEKQWYAAMYRDHINENGEFVPEGVQAWQEAHGGNNNNNQNNNNNNNPSNNYGNNNTNNGNRSSYGNNNYNSNNNNNNINNRVVGGGGKTNISGGMGTPAPRASVPGMDKAAEQGRLRREAIERQRAQRAGELPPMGR